MRTTINLYEELLADAQRLAQLGGTQLDLQSIPRLQGTAK